jgi:hypothetical protein
MKQLIIALSAVLITVACKKENDTPTSLAGQWRGNIYTMSAYLVNKENGKSRIYIGTLYEDTTSASYKWDGSYVKTSKGYEFKYYNDTVVTCVLHTEEVSPQRLTGTAFVLQAALDFDLKKQ